jgi:LysM repeat protein
MDRSPPLVRRLVVVGAGLALLAACSNGGGGTSSSTTVSASTAFSTIPIATTTTAAASGQGGTGPTDSTGGGGAATGSATYTVVSGDYLLGIAKKLGVPLQSLLDANGMNPNSLITPGQKLKIPAATTGSTTATTAAGGSGGSTVSSNPSTASSASSAAATTTTTVADAPGTYTVRPNDGWSIIAARLGVAAADLAAFNDLTLNSVLIPGQKLRIPPARATTTTAKA